MPVNQKFPIVLVHGIARFDYLTEKIRSKLNLPEDPLNDEFQYFKGIKTYLESKGKGPVFHTNQDFAGSVELRASQLQNRVNQIIQAGAEKVHIIAHSMGGLDARHMIVDLEMADRVASLTTTGTPHNGTILADYLLGNGGFLLMKILRTVLHINADGVRDLTVSACDAFNRRAENSEAENQVVYQTYASSEEQNLLFAPLVLSYLYILSREGRNDGLVPFKSQQWKSELVSANGTLPKKIKQYEFSIPADHLNQVGWWDLEEAPVNLFGGINITDYIKQKVEYENRIKNIYLEIAENL